MSASADLSLTITDSPDPVFVGNNLTYTFFVTNNGPDAASGIILSNRLAMNVVVDHFTVTNGSCIATNGSFVCSLGGLPNNVGLAVDLVVRPISGSSVLSRTSLWANEPDPNPGNNSNRLATTTVLSSAVDLTLTLTDSPDPVAVGSELLYNIEVSNIGSVPATGVMLSNVLPAGVTLNSMVATNGSCSLSNGVVVCTLSNLANGSGTSVQLFVTPTNVGSLTMTSWAFAAEGDANPANNSARTAVTTVTPVSADLWVEVAASPNPVVVGGNINYTFTVGNNGPSTATGVVLSNPAPSSLIIHTVTATNGPCQVSNGVLLCNFGALAVGASIVVQSVATPVSVQNLTNLAFVFGNEPDPNDWNSRYVFTTTDVIPVAPGPDMNLPRLGHLSTLLLDGRVLITGGSYSVNKTAEIYDPQLEAFLLTGEMSVPRSSHSATLLADGTVLIVGGYTGSADTASVDIYDPTNDVFHATNSLPLPRAGHTATRLPDGKVVIAGDRLRTTTAILIYDPVTGSFASGGDLLTARSSHSATLIGDGKILFAGGATNSPSAELYDPQTLTSIPVGDMVAYRNDTSAALLPSGQVLILGGATAELFDPITHTFTETGPPRVTRSWARATLLQDGRVLYSGGASPIDYESSVEIYDPASGTFSYSPPMTDQRVLHSTVVLKDGRVLITGGHFFSASESSEIYVVKIDVDQDGMDDQWEVDNGFSPGYRDDAIEDADHDGHTNLQEYLAGTDPNDPTSIMRIQTIQANSTTVRVHFNTVPGKRYRVERTKDLQGGNWAIVADNVPGTGAIVQVTDSILAGEAKQMYRVQLIR